MATDTSQQLLKGSIYQVFPRCYSKKGSLKEVIADLDRIADLGFEYLYFLPLHEPGILNRKGTCGSPYSIRDYYEIDPKLGSLDDFHELLAKAHGLGLKVITDIVINHTACDAIFTKTNPEYYLLDENNQPTRKVPDWSDVYDLDYHNEKLQAELIAMMEYWARIGVDGFRCDVAPIVPLDFWLRARKALKAINPDFFLLAESGEERFIEIMREKKVPILTDNELYAAFDICYCYDLWDFFKEAFNKETDLREFARVINYQQSMLPINNIKCWFLENHDQPRIASIISDHDRIDNWLSFVLLAKGMGFVYAGEECYDQKRPSLFEKEEVVWNRSFNQEALIRRCNKIKKELPFSSYINFRMIPYRSILSFGMYDDDHEYLAYFDVNNRKERVETSLKDGKYFNLLNDKEVEVHNGLLLVDEPLFIRIK